MATKRSTVRTKSARAASKKSATGRSTRKTVTRRASVKKKSTARKSVAKRTAKSVPSAARVNSSPPKRKRPAARRPAALGRPKVPGTAELDQMFLKDYEARQVFAFLGVRTVKELEEHPPEEIIQRLTSPVVRTVERIRKALAVNNRYLAGDQQFAVQFCEQIR